MEVSQEHFFSIHKDGPLVNMKLGHDLYINSSGVEGKEHFVRIFPKGEILYEEILEGLIQKYQRLYVPESQRELYFKGLLGPLRTDEEKTSILKDTAIEHLNTMFSGGDQLSHEVLTKSMQACQDSVSGLAEVVGDYKIDELQSLIGSLSFHDFYTYDHSLNTSMYSMALLKAFKKSATKSELLTAGMGGLLHDLGKVKISTRIINNSGKISEEDFKIIQTHPDLGKELLDAIADDALEGVDLKIVKRVVHEHHENYNGTGYPQKLSDDSIHLYARITSIADFFDAITTKRSYHEALTTGKALAVMEKSSGKKIDPKLFNAFKKYVANAEREITKVELPDSFDPCSPCDCLPFKSIRTGQDATEEELLNHGKVHFDDEKKKRSA